MALNGKNAYMKLKFSFSLSVLAFLLVVKAREMHDRQGFIQEQ